MSVDLTADAPMDGWCEDSVDSLELSAVQSSESRVQAIVTTITYVHVAEELLSGLKEGKEGKEENEARFSVSSD